MTTILPASPRSPRTRRGSRARASARSLTVLVWGAYTLGAATLSHAQIAADYEGRLGFRDPRHTGEAGFQWSAVLGISDAGYTVGASERFVGTPDVAYPDLTDLSLWMGNPWGGSRSIGFYDATHTSATGYHFSELVAFTRHGFALGQSQRFHGAPVVRGLSAWVAGPSGPTRRIGLFYDEEPPLPDGTVVNIVIAANDAGQSIGYAPTHRGQAAWQANPDGSTRRIGFYDAAHTAPSAQPHNTPVAINSSGTAIGYTTAGENSWAWVQRKNGGPVEQIGLYDAAHTNAEGIVVNRAVAMNDRGQVIGTVRRGEPAFDDTYAFAPWVWTPGGGGTIPLDTGNFTGGSAYLITNSGLVGGSEMSINMFSYARAWVYDTNTGERRFVGFSGEEDGPPDSLVALTESGVAVGRSSPYRGALCWMALPGQPTQRIGFYDGGYYWGPSYRSRVVAVADNGLTIGESDFTATDGVTAWLASPVDASTRAIGLVDGTYTGGDVHDFQLRTSHPTHVTNSGFVAGHSVRYHWDFTEEGQTAWIYNSVKDRYAKFVFSVRPSDGYAHSEVHVLHESGIALGSYTRFAADGTDLGERAFVWVTGRGAYDLASVLDVDPETVGWDYLARGIVVNEQGVFAGHGVPSDAPAGSQGVFLARLD